MTGHTRANAALIAMPILMLAIGVAAIAQRSETGSGQRPATAPSTQPATFTQADIIERYDADGRILEVPRHLILTGEEAKRFVECFPQLPATPAPLPAWNVQQRIRFQITFSLSDGTKVVVCTSQRLERWWTNQKSDEFSPSARTLFQALTRDLKQDPSILPKSPVVRVDLVETQNGYGDARDPVLRVALTGEAAARVAQVFPELGVEQVPGLASGGIPRFFVTFTRANGQTHQVLVYDQIAEAWHWSDGTTTWLMHPSAARRLLSVCNDALRAAATQR